MREIPRERKLEVADYYLLGYSYSEIENVTSVSHGSVVNIVKELEDGKLSVPGTPSDQVNDLRQLCLELNKKGLNPSQAQLGLLFFQRLQALKITPELMDGWSELAKKLIPSDFPAKDFLQAAMRLHELEKSEGKSFDTLADEYADLTEEVKQLQPAVDLLNKNKDDLGEVIEDLSRQFDLQMRAKGKLDSDMQIQTAKLSETKQSVKEAQEEKSQLDKETKDLKRKRSKYPPKLAGRRKL